MTKSRVLVTGAGGMLGSDLVPTLRAHGYLSLPTDLIQTPGIRLLDVRDYAAVKRTISRCKPSYVLHLAAETDVEKCEANPDHANLTNVIGTENLAIVCRDRNIPLVYIGTSGVFDGRKVNQDGAHEAYTEFDDPHPINVYGMSKYQGEKTVTQTCKKYLIVRAGWMIGGLERDKKFVGKILAQLRSNPKKIYAVNDRAGSPTYTLDFANALLFLIESDFSGLYHAASTDAGTRYEVAKQILEILGRTDVKLISVSSNFFKNSYPAPRAASQSLRNYKLELRGIQIMPPWQTALKNYLVRWTHLMQLTRRQNRT
jgi:dTDP-4-dehydrorhamnose reductase